MAWTIKYRDLFGETTLRVPRSKAYDIDKNGDDDVGGGGGDDVNDILKKMPSCYYSKIA